MMKIFAYIWIILVILILLFSCQKDILPSDEISDETDSPSTDSLTYNPDWSFLTHGNANVSYETVFPQDSVNRIEIIMTTETWNNVRQNMISLFGNDFGKSSGNTGGGGFPGGGGGEPSFPDETDYVDVLLKFNGKQWKDVGFRLKGNSSLSTAWKEGIYKLPFKLNFDKFEDEYQAIKNQHFYGFKELSFSPGFRDMSLMREKIAPDIFRMAGIAAAKTAFYRVYINFGTGLKYCGVYTCIELPEDNMIKDQFGDDNDNIYKPESKLSTFVASEFERKNNKESTDYSDIQAFFSALNSNQRTSNPEEWRNTVEAVFNMNNYLKFLAVNNAIVNWDSYGNMAHNYYLYNHPEKKLTWIPWDHNEALSGNPGITGSSAGSAVGMSHTGISLKMNEVSSSWPLLRYVADDPVYFEMYKANMKSFCNDVFTVEKMNALIDKYYAMISPYAIGENGEQTSYSYLTGSSSFTNAYNELKQHITKRRIQVENF